MNPQLPVVLISGMNLSGRLWSRCDLPESAMRITPQFSSIEENVEHLLKELPERFVLVGLSLGANIAMRLATAAEHRVAGLMLMATNPRAPTKEQIEGWSRVREDTRTGMSPRSYQKKILSQLISSEALGDSDLRDQVLESAADLNPRILDAQLKTQATRVDERLNLTRLQIPTLILAGEKDALCPVANHSEIAALIPRSELTVVAGTGHLIPIEAPEAVDMAIARLYQQAAQ